MRDIESAQGHFDFHTRRHMLAEHFNNAPNRVNASTRSLRDLNNNHVSLTCAMGVLRRDDDFMVNSAVVRNNNAHTLFGKIAANNGLFARFDNLIDKGFALTSPVGTTFSGFNKIIMQQVLHLPCANKQVAGFVFWSQKAVTIAMANHASTKQLLLLQHRITLLFSKLNLPFALHGA